MDDKSVPGRRIRGGASPLMTVAATVGFGLNFWSWALLASFGPLLREQYGMDAGAYAALLAVPLLLGSVARLPVGVLTDRYGARVMLPAISVVAAMPVFVVAVADSVPVLVGAACAAGLGGAAFAAGVPLVANWQPAGRRGVALGLFGAGNGGAAVAGVAAEWWTGAGGAHVAGLVLGGLLVGYAVVAAVLVRDTVTGPRASFARECAEALRAATGSLSALYAAAFGVILVLACYLPLLLTADFRMAHRTAIWITAAVVAVAAASRVLGGRLADGAKPVPALAASYLAVGVLTLVLGLQPESAGPVVVTLVLTGIAVSDGIAAGIVLGLLGKAAPPGRVGAVAGVTGAVGGLGALLVPLVIAGVYHLDGSYSTALVLLATVLFGVGVYVRLNTARIPFGVVLPANLPPDPSHSTLTVAVASGRDHAAVRELGALATHDELVVVAGRTRPTADRYHLIAGLRIARPGCFFVGLLIDAHATAKVLDHDVNVIADLLNSGSTPVLVTAPAGDAWVALYLAHRLGANRVVEIVDEPADGVAVRELWIGPRHDPRERVFA